MLFPLPTEPIISVSQMSVFAAELDHPEGIALDRDFIPWAGGELGQIYRIDRGRTSELVRLGGFCLGITISPAQDLWVCNSGLHALQQVDRTGRVIKTLDRVAGKRIETPNFSVFDRMGNLYFSDSGTWNGGNGCVYRLRANGVAEHFAGPFFFANGIALNAAEDALFVVESQRDRVLQLEIRPSGDAGETRVYAEGLARVPDGIAFDSEQNLFVTCYATDCIYRVNPDRSVELFAFDPEGTTLARPTNIAFGGEDGTTMLVANLGRWHITALPAPSPGQPLAGQ